MSLESILCFVGTHQSELGALDVAFNLGKIFNSNIRFLHISPDPFSCTTFGEGVFMMTELIADIEKENKRRLEKAKKDVTQAAKQYNIALEFGTAAESAPCAHFMHCTGYVDTITRHEGRLCDLIIIGRRAINSDALYDPAIMTAIFDTGRPILLLPPNYQPNSVWGKKNISFAWNGNLEAARAALQSMPLLKQADKIYLLHADKNKNPGDETALSSLVDYFHTHDVIAEPFMIDCEDDTIAEALLAKAKLLKTQLLVMGAYGHSRFREMIFGGVTRHMLEHCPIPLLLSH